MNTTGGCLCGAVRFAVEGPPSTVHYCHCSMCRRATGGPFAVLAWFRRDHVTWGSEAPRMRRSSSIAQRGFCAHCGTPLLLAYDGKDEVALTVGSLDDPGRFLPDHHYGVESRLPWADCGDGMPESATREDLADDKVD
jgi:hypothetical protein